jgi:hypothetical protein
MVAVVALQFAPMKNPVSGEEELATLLKTRGFTSQRQELGTYCMTASLANGGEGLGTCGLPESKVRELVLEAGFHSVRRSPFGEPVQRSLRSHPAMARSPRRRSTAPPTWRLALLSK